MAGDQTTHHRGIISHSMGMTPNSMDRGYDNMGMTPKSMDRGMIPAPLLSRVYKPVFAKERSDDMSEIRSTDGIPAPLLAGGAYRVRQKEADSMDNRVVQKRRLEISEERPVRMHVRRIKKKRPVFDR